VSQNRRCKRIPRQTVEHERGNQAVLSLIYHHLVALYIASYHTLSFRLIQIFSCLLATPRMEPISSRKSLPLPTIQVTSDNEGPRTNPVQADHEICRTPVAFPYEAWETPFTSPAGTPGRTSARQVTVRTSTQQSSMTSIVVVPQSIPHLTVALGSLLFMN
jgi:hypothetical protein